MQRFVAGELGRTLLIALIVLVVAAGLDALHAWESLDDFTFDTFTVAAAGEQPAPIVIVAIDDPSLADIGVRWPWPRDLHARLVDRLTAAGASVIAFDVVFSEPSDTGADAELARAIRESGRVVLASDMVMQNTPRFRGWQLVEPLPPLREAGAAPGLASVEIDRDQVVRRFPQPRDAFWRVALDRYFAVHGKPPYPAEAPGPGALLRFQRDSTIEHVSYYQALDPALLPADALRDKLVLVGLVLKASPEAAQRHADTYATPFLRVTHAFSHGVEVQAQFIAGALSGRAVKPLPWAVTAAIVLAVLGIGIVLLQRWNAGPATLFLVLGPALLLALSFGLFAMANLWLPVGLPMGIAAGLYVGRGATAYVDEARRRAAIRRAFEHYVAPAVVAEMTAHPERLVLGGQRKELTVMFTDLAGFTSLSEHLAPEAVAQMLNEHLTAMTDIVLRHGGTVDKFIGDGIMAFWGAPLDDAQHALRAVQAAVDMQEGMRQLREQRTPGSPALHMRIGLNTGEVVVGNLGSKVRFEYTAIGDCVNLASRLESVNRVYGTSILLSAAVAERLADTGVRYVDSVRVKGKSEPIEIYTPCQVEALVHAGEAARSAHRTRNVEGARAAWTRVVELAPGDSIAGVQLARLFALAEGSTPERWSGIFDLESK